MGQKLVVATLATSSKKGKAKVRGVSKKTYRAKYFASVQPLKKLRNMLRNASLNLAGKWATTHGAVEVLKSLAKKKNRVGARAVETLAIMNIK